MLRAMPETPLITYLRIQQATDRQVLAALRVSATSVSGELRRLQAATGAGNEMRRSQLLRSQAAINRELATLFQRVGDVVQANAATAAAAGAESILRESRSLLADVLSASDLDYLTRSAQASASQSLEVLRQRVSGSSYVPLAESVWGNQAQASSHVQDLINSALARGASAAELARDVRAYVNPNTPGGLRYASMRLARTELNNAFHAAQVKQAQDEPWVTAVRWHLSGSHPVPDECNEYADRVHFEGGEAGMWKPEEVPVKPHPNCLCYTTPETPDPDQFIEQYLKGDYDQYLNDQGLELPPAPAAPDPVTTSAPARPKSTKPSGTSSRSAYAVKEDAIQDAVQSVNPNAVHRAVGGVQRLFHRTRGSSINCQKTSYAAELRARGMKVVAEEGLGTKSGIAGLRAQWKPRPGEANVRGFSGKDLGTLLKRVDKDPVGSRYIMVSTWKDGGSHVYNAVKQSDGSLRFFDGQRKMLDATGEYSARSAKMEGFRVDNMEPAARHRGIYKEEGK